MSLMDSSQESAIEAIEPELISQLPYVDFINFLIQSASGFFLKATEVFPIRGDLNATLAEKIRRLMKLLGSKPGGWEILISYLRGNGLKKLAQKLVLLRQGQQADHLLERCLLSLFRYYQNNRYVVESIHGTADNIFSSSPVETRNIHHYLEKAAFHLRKERKHVGLIHLPERDPMFFVLAPLDPDVSVLDSAAGCLLNSKTVTEVPWSDSNVLLIYTVKNHQLLRTENSEIRSVQMQLFSDGEWLERFACAKTWPFSQIINSNKSVLPPKLSFTPLNAVKPKVAPKPKSLSLDTDIHLIGIINDSDQRLEESMLIAPNIEIIDFSNTKLEKLRFPESLKATLTSLVLYNVPNLHKFEADIFELKELKHLDVSQAMGDTGNYPNPSNHLKRIANSFSKLVSLDISGTNLWSGATTEIVKEMSGLKFLGLFDCIFPKPDVSMAGVQISGNHNEAQLLLSLDRYGHRPAMILRVLEEIDLFYAKQGVMEHIKALELVLSAMDAFDSNQKIRHLGCSLFGRIMKDSPTTSDQLKHRLLSSLIRNLEIDKSIQIVNNFYVCVRSLKFPTDLWFHFKRVSRLLLYLLVCDTVNQEFIVNCLLAMMAEESGETKLVLGSLNTIEIVCRLIEERGIHKLQDTTAFWKLLVALTDDTPHNCAKFILAKGMELVKMCLAILYNVGPATELMVITLGNVAEVKNLRRHFLDADLISPLCAILSDFNAPMNHRYCSAGVLANILSEYPTEWPLPHFSVVTVTELLVQTIALWDPADRTVEISYRKLTPLLELSITYNSIGSQYLGLWALAQLTSSSADTYCKMLLQECTGIEKVREVAKKSENSFVQGLAAITIDNFLKWNNKYLEEVPQSLNAERETYITRMFQCPTSWVAKPLK